MEGAPQRPGQPSLLPPEGQARMLTQGWAGLGSAAGPEAPAAGAAPSTRPGEAGGPTLCLRAGLAAQTVRQAAAEALPLGRPVSGANTGMHILLYVLCFLFLDTFDFFT